MLKIETCEQNKRKTVLSIQGGLTNEALIKPLRSQRKGTERG